MPKIRIKSVSFRANTSLDSKFNHIHIEASADVPLNERPEAVLDALKKFVAKELKFAKEGQVETAPARRFRID